MTGIDWTKIDEPLFARIVDTVLGRIYGERGFAPEGRGGDEGIDYTVDDDAIIFQYKFFPDGVNTASRRRQVKRSFLTAIKHNPKEWVVIIPAKLLKGMRDHIASLSTEVEITIYDVIWLDNRLIDYPDLAEYFQHRTEIDYLFAKAELLKVNPLFRSPGDVVDKTAALQRAIDASDPDWTLNVTTSQGGIIHTLRAKDPHAPQRSPISISYTAVLPAASPELKQLRLSWKYGITEPIHLSGTMVQDFKITGPEFVAYDGPVDALELLPDPDSASPWANTDLTIRDADGKIQGTHLGRSRALTRGDSGMTIEVHFGDLLRMLFRTPDKEGEHGLVNFTTEDFTGQPIHDVLAVSNFLTQLWQGSSADFIVNGSRLMRILLNTSDEENWAAAFEQTRSIADDLAIIEREVNVRFRYPQTVSWEERVDVRNARLMLEGHVVAHPTQNAFSAKINDEFDPSLEPFLDGKARWLMWTSSPGHLSVLDKIIEVPELSVGGPTRLSQDNIIAVQKAIEKQATKDLPLKFVADADDRLRLWLPDRLTAEILAITPWDIPEIEQPPGTLAALVSTLG